MCSFSTHKVDNAKAFLLMGVMNLGATSEALSFNFLFHSNGFLRNSHSGKRCCDPEIVKTAQRTYCRVETGCKWQINHISSYQDNKFDPNIAEESNLAVF